MLYEQLTLTFPSGQYVCENIPKSVKKRQYTGIHAQNSQNLRHTSKAMLDRVLKMILIMPASTFVQHNHPVWHALHILRPRLHEYVFI